MNTVNYLIGMLICTLAVIVWCIVVIAKLRADIKWHSGQTTSYLKAIHGLLVPHPIFVPKHPAGESEESFEARKKNYTEQKKNSFKPFKLRCNKCGHEGPQAVEENGPHHTATCEECGKFIKHLSAGELRVWKNYSTQSV